jgi:hypothetical protein
LEMRQIRLPNKTKQIKKQFKIKSNSKKFINIF